MRRILNFGIVNPIPYMTKLKMEGKIGRDVDDDLCNEEIFERRTIKRKKREKRLYIYFIYFILY